MGVKDVKHTKDQSCNYGLHSISNSLSMKNHSTYGQVQKIWPQRPYSSEKLGKWLFIVAGVLKQIQRPTTCPLWIK